MLFSAETFSFFAVKYVVEETVCIFFVVEYSDVTWDAHARTIAWKAATASCQPLLQRGWLMGMHDMPSNINCFSAVLWKRCEQQWHVYEPFRTGTVVSAWSGSAQFYDAVWTGY